MSQMWDCMTIMLSSIIMIYIRDCIEQSIMVPYFNLWEENFNSIQPDWIVCFKGSIQTAYRQLINIYLRIGGCIMKEMILVKMMDITKDCWKDMITDGMKLKNINSKYSHKSLGRCTGWGDYVSAVKQILKHWIITPQFVENHPWLRLSKVATRRFFEQWCEVCVFGYMFGRLIPSLSVHGQRVKQYCLHVFCLNINLDRRTLVAT